MNDLTENTLRIVRESLLMFLWCTIQILLIIVINLKNDEIPLFWKATLTGFCIYFLFISITEYSIRLKFLIRIHVYEKRIINLKQQKNTLEQQLETTRKLHTFLTEIYKKKGGQS